MVESFLDPAVYTAVGLDRARAVHEARHNPQHRESRLWMAERVTGFLRKAGIIGGPTTQLWGHAGLLA